MMAMTNPISMHVKHGKGKNLCTNENFLFFSSFLTIYQKVEILKDQPTFQLFITLEELIMMPKMFEYLLLHRSDDLENL